MVGVQRQYTGTAGRIENSQVAVYLTYASGKGHALIDRRLYLPRSWNEDADRLAGAGVPDETAFATKPSLAQGMITDALAGGARAAWAAGCRPGVGRGANAGTTGRSSTRATKPLTRPLGAPGTTGC